MCYLALTTEYITLVDEKNNVEQFDISKLTKITKPDSDLIYIEYQKKKGVQYANIGSRENLFGSS